MKTKKMSWMQPFYSMVFEGMITNSAELPILSRLIIWINFLQVASFTFMPLLTSHLSLFQEKGIAWYEGYQVIFFIVRPSLAFAYYNVKWIQILASIVSSLIPLMLFGSFISLFILTVIKTPHRQTATTTAAAPQQTLQNQPSSANKQSTSSPKHFRILSIVITVSSLYNYSLFVMTMDCLIQIGIVGEFGIAGNTNSSEVSVSLQVICYISGVISVVLSVICSSFLEQSMGIQEINLNRTRSTYISTWINMIKLTTMLLSAVGLSQQNSSENASNLAIQMIINGFVCCYFILIFIDFLRVIPMSSISKTKHYVASFTLCGCGSFVASFYSAAEIITSKQLTCICLVILPLLTAALLTLWHRIHQFLLFEVFQKETQITSSDRQYLEKKISLFYNNKQLIIDTQYLKVIGQMDQHKKTCKDLYCFCKSGKGAILSHDETNFIVDEAQIERYLRHLCRVDLNRKLADRVDFHLQFLRYMDFFSKSQKQTYSVQCIIDFLNESDRMNKDIGVYQEASLLTMLDVIKRSMKQQISESLTDNEIEKTTLSIETYVLYESGKDELKALLIDCLQYKIQAYEKMRKSFEDISDLEQTNLGVNKRYADVEKCLLSMFARFPNQRLQNFFCFFLTEIMNSFKRALNASRQIHFGNQGKDFTQEHKNGVMDIFGDDIVSATVTMGKVWGKIQRVSDKLPQLLGYQKHEFQYVNHIKEIMPPTVAKIHDNLIKYLMTTGQDNILHSRRDLFLKRKNNFLIRAQVFISMNLYHNEELPYITLAKVLPTKSGFLVINNTGIVEGIDQNLLEKFGYTGRLQITSLPLYLSLEIRQLMPNYEQLLGQIDEKKNVLEKEKVPFWFPTEYHPTMANLLQHSNKQYVQQDHETEEVKKTENEEQLNSDSGSIAHNSSKINLRTIKYGMRNKKIASSRVPLFNRFEVDLNIEKRDLHVLTGKYTYYVIEVKSASSLISGEDFSKSLESVSSQLISSSPQIPKLAGGGASGQPNTFNSNAQKNGSQLFFSSVKQAVQQTLKNSTKEQSLDIPSQLIGYQEGSQKEEGVSCLNARISPNPQNSLITAIKNELVSKPLDNSLQIFFGDPVSQVNNENELNEKVSSLETPQLSLNRSKENNKDIENNLEIKDKTKKDSEDNKKTADSADFSFHEENNNKLFGGLKKKKSIGRGSGQSSVTSVSQNLDKYNYFEDFLESSIHTFWMKLIGVLSFCEYLTLLITTAIIILVSQSSFSTLSLSINKLSLSSNVSFHYFNYISQIDNYLSNCHGIFNTFDIQQEEFSYLQPRLAGAFQNFSSNYRDLYQMTSLQASFTGKVIEYYQPFQGQQKYKNITLLSALEQTVFHISILQEMSLSEWLDDADLISNSSYQFLHQNFVSFQKFLSNLSNEYLLETKEDLSGLVDVLLLVTLLLNLLTIIIYVLSFIGYFKFEKSIKIILKLILNVSITQVETELEHLRTIVENIIITEDTSFKYIFNLPQIEKRAVIIEKKKKRLGQREARAVTSGISHRAKLNVQIQSEKHKISRFYFLSISSYILFVGYSILNFTLSDVFVSSFWVAFQFFQGTSQSILILPELITMQYIISQSAAYSNQLAKADDLSLIKSSLFNQKLAEAVSFSNQAKNIFTLSALNEESQNQFYSLSNSNICSFPPFADSDFQETCPNFYNSQLVNGALQTMNLFANIFAQNQKESFMYAIDQDIVSNDISLSSTMVSLQLKKASLFLGEHLESLTKSKYATLLTISILYLVLVTLPQIFMVFSELPLIFERFKMSKRLILFIPPQTLLLEDSFMKVLKAISNKLQIAR